jgi:FAD/FMN-containing dehydrogenase
VHAEDPAGVAAAMGTAWPRVPAPRVHELHQELKRRFDPGGRLNPGRQVETS